MKKKRWSTQLPPSGTLDEGPAQERRVKRRTRLHQEKAKREAESEGKGRVKEQKVVMENERSESKQREVRKERRETGRVGSDGAREG